MIITYVEGDRQDRVVYERPQPLVPDGPLSTFDRIRISQFATDDELTIEARRIFADMKLKRRIGEAASLSSVFIARTAGAALEMGL
ncbi:hypothetical protein SRABI98_00765 [Microbacterium sp. Bi98]|uniref:hypothetical protein n=1 Tax=Microbacterium sp. Bi98 TaxID=2821116 RepID=UPI001E0B2E09|nr:hypothetical protein [Microbacterium sp. Bi98]CAH0150525.1 hypothetical protein SRABI98_00765 [Microbacterium sp. Bi98]